VIDIFLENYFKSEKEKIDISIIKNNSKLKNVVNAIKTLKPLYYIPAAGPAIFPYLNSFYSSGKDNIFIHQDTIAKVLNENDINNVLYPIPGDIIDESIIDNKPTLPPTPNELSSYKNCTYDFWSNYISEFSITDLELAIQNRLDQIWDLEFDCDTLLKFQWGDMEDEQLTIDLQYKHVSRKVDLTASKIYILRAEKKYFSLMCTKNRWQDIYLSLRAQPYRNPDEFNNFINLFLFSDVDNIRECFLSSLAIPSEKILKINKSGICFAMNRYCPHQGADLSNVEINDNNEVVCPRHGWHFSLDRSGQCLNSHLSLFSKKYY
jgi:UDP-MurNAc hydroxylase